MLALALAAVAGLVWLVLTPPPDLSPAVRSAPNGYSNLIQAGSLLTGEPPAWESTQPEDFRTYLSPTNRAALQMARQGLSRPCRVPLEYSKTYLAEHIPQLANLKRVATALRVEARLAQLENRPADALRAYCDLARLGEESARGGVLIDKLVGLACESMALAPLNSLVNTLNASQCKELLATLEGLDRKAETMEAVITQERAFCARAYGWRGRIIALLTNNRLRQTEESCAKKAADRQRERRLLLVNTAVRVYQLDKGEPPKNFSDLVPTYLKAIPKDPATGTNIQYRW